MKLTMKKITAILLVLSLMLLSLPVLAEESSVAPVWLYDDLSLNVYVEGMLEGDVTIPASINEHATNALQFSALCGQNTVTSLTLPDTMYALHSGAISDMEKLQSVTLNEELEVIDSNNFSYCPSLTSVTIPASVRLIGNAFSNCDNLKEIHFTGVCPIFTETDFCFYWLPEDYVIYVPDDQLDAYAEALQDAYGGAADHLQPSGQNAVVCESKVADDWFVFDASTGTITGYTQYNAYLEIPESIGGVAVKAIADGALRGNRVLFGVTLPEGLEQVGTEAFYDANNITYLKFPSTLKTICDDAFNHISCKRIDWSEGLETIGARAFRSTQLKILTLPSTVKTIGESAFERTFLSELYLSGDLESIDSRAFADCFLSYMAFDFYAPIDIAADAFANSNVADLDLPWDSSFENRAQYAEILRDQCPNCTVWINNPENAGVAEHPINDPEHCTFENGVWTMYKGDQPRLTVWTGYDDIDVTGLGDGLFKGNQTIQSFYPHHCGWFTTIGNEAFADSSLEYFEPFGSIATIGSGAFRNCLNLKTLTLPASLTSIGEGALDGCDNLQELIVLCDPAILPDGLLDECFAHTMIYAASDASDEQVRVLSEKAHRPWYAPISRLGEPINDLIEMPYAMLSIDDFWYDTEYARLDRYLGYELNLYLPREAEGVTLDTLGGDMLGRASAGDNYDMELPVRSVVIPENYTNIYSTTFAGCETLETVICYAPLEVTANMFEGCTNLREVVFVNGVRSLGYGTFYGCDNLETVYVGPYVEEVSDDAFAGCSNFDLSKCITDPALMPDLDALLAAVKSAPIPEPTPAPTAAPAMPVSEAGAPYVGTWQAVTLEMEGEAYQVADMGMEMLLTLNADGTAESYDGEITETGTWTIENGMIIIGGEIEGTMPMTAADDGTLVMEEDGMKLIFAKADGETAPSTAVSEPTTELTGDASAYIGVWQAVTLEMEGESYNVVEMGLEMNFTLYADGTAESYDGEINETGTWTIENGSIIIGDGIEGTVPMTVADDGTLVMEEDGVKLIFAKADATSTKPEVPVIDAEAIAAVGSAGVAYIGTWQADTLEMDGDVYPLADMGMEMSFTLNADGTAESFDGETTETGTWSLENGLLILDGVAMLPNEEGQLVMEEDGMKLVFVKSDAASATEEEGFTGVWYGCYMVTGAMNGDPRTLFEITLTINEDGTANLAYPTDEFWHWTENEDGSLLMVKDSDDMEMPLHKLDENFLCFGSTDGDGNAFGGYIIFSRNAQAIWTPDMLLQTNVSAETAASVDVSAEYSDKFERKYICTSAQSSGITMDASLLGGEYALTFHANGTVDFVMVGTEIVGLPWTTGDNAFIIDYYGTKLEVVFAEEGVDMDYFSMLMHFVPEA